jgi:uncharacterized membrane protein YcaP (DUF421 family)
MGSVFRGLAIYFFLLLVFRIAGKRTLAQITTFDFVILLIISEVTQQAMIDTDNSLTNGFVLIVTLVGTDILLSLIRQKWKRVETLLSGTPLVIVEDGKPLTDRMDRSRVDVNDVLMSARELQGIERLDQIKYAVLETDGKITIIPKKEG